MRIGEIVRQTGTSRDTIRYYERLGLLRAAGRPSEFNNYKAYPADTARRLGLIQQAKNLGFSLAEIVDLLNLWESAQLSPTQMQARLREKMAVIDEKISQLEAMRQSLTRSLAACEPLAASCQLIADKSVDLQGKSANE